jgi:hypothetical protein
MKCLSSPNGISNVSKLANLLPYFHRLARGRTCTVRAVSRPELARVSLPTSTRAACVRPHAVSQFSSQVRFHVSYEATKST